MRPMPPTFAAVCRKPLFTAPVSSSFQRTASFPAFTISIRNSLSLRKPSSRMRNSSRSLMERHLRKSRFLYNRRAGTFSLPGRYPAAHKVQGHKEYKVYQVYTSGWHDVYK